MRHFILFITTLSTLSAFACRRDCQWNFGAYLALDHGSASISSNIVVNLPSPLSSAESSASICDLGNNLLFYTDGRSVWDATNTMMSNVVAASDKLAGHQSSSQGVTIIPDPGSSHRYYIITIGELGAEIRYSVVDMNLGNGNGNIVPGQKNQPLTSSLVTEKLAVVPHSNGFNWWVIAHEYNPLGTTNTFLVWELTAAGFSSPSTYNMGRSIGSAAIETVGYLKASQDGTKLAATYYNYGVQVFDFNNSSGAITGLYKELTNSGGAFLAPGLFVPYGLEFSPNGTKLYVTVDGEFATKLIQWDLDQPSVNGDGAITFSDQKPIVAFSGAGVLGNGSYGALALDPTETRIYVSSMNNIYVPPFIERRLGFIEFSNESAQAPNTNFYFSPFGFSFDITAYPGSVHFGLPNTYPTDVNGCLPLEHNEISLVGRINSENQVELLTSIEVSNWDSVDSIVFQKSIDSQEWTVIDQRGESFASQLSSTDKSFQEDSHYKATLLMKDGYSYQSEAVFLKHEGSKSIASLRVGPNPFQDTITIRRDDSEAALNLVLSNTMGAIVWSGSMQGLELEVELGTLAQGVYYLRVTNTQGKAKIFKLNKQVQ